MTVAPRTSVALEDQYGIVWTTKVHLRWLKQHGMMRKVSPIQIEVGHDVFVGGGQNTAAAGQPPTPKLEPLQKPVPLVNPLANRISSAQRYRVQLLRLCCVRFRDLLVDRQLDVYRVVSQETMQKFGSKLYVM